MRLPVWLEPEPYRLSLTNRPVHPEAYPSLRVGEAHREARQGRDRVLWRDRRQIIAGAAAASWPDASSLVIRYTIEERDYFDQAEGEITFRVRWKGSRDDNRRPFAACPVCARDVDVLVFFDRWCCTSKVHGLRHRSAQLSREVRWSEELIELEGAIAAGVAVGAARKRHQRLVEQRDELLGRLAEQTMSANTLLLARVTREWVRPLAARQLV